MDFRSRIRKLQTVGHPILVSNPNDVFYYTGYKPGTDDNPLLLVPEKGKPTLFLSPLTTGLKLAYTKTSTFDKLSLPPKTGYDEYHLPARLYLRFKRKSRLIRAAEKIKKPRRIKSSEELAAMKKAISINKKALEAVDIYGKSEAEAARSIESQFHEQGAGVAFETIVSSGPNAGNNIHHISGSRKVQKKDMVIVDFGSRWKGYSSDITRTFFQGERQQKIVNMVKEIQKECIDMVRPGVQFDDINDFYSKKLEKLGYEPRHGIGHGIGIFIHESAVKLEKGMVITIEPGIYIRNFGGCRIEDMILVAKKPVVLSDSIPQMSR